MTDADVRSRVATDPEWAAAVADAEATLRAPDAQIFGDQGSDINSVISTIGVQHLSDLNADVWYDVNRSTGETRQTQKYGARRPQSYIVGIGDAYYIDRPRKADVYINAHEYTATDCASSWTDFWSGLPGCGAGNTGLFYSPRATVGKYYQRDYNIWGLQARALSSTSTLNVGSGNYKWIGVETWLSTTDFVYGLVYYEVKVSFPGGGLRVPLSVRR